MARPKKDRSAEPQREPQLYKASKNTSIDKIVKQRSKNPLMTITDQAKLNGVSKQALSKLLKRHGVQAENVDAYKEHRADLFAGKGELCLSLIDEDAIKKMIDKAPMAAVTLMNSCYNNERLERGQSTSNVATILATAVIEAGKQWEKLGGSGEGSPVVEGEIVEG